MRTGATSQPKQKLAKDCQIQLNTTKYNQTKAPRNNQIQAKRPRSRNRGAALQKRNGRAGARPSTDQDITSGGF